jgi:cytochrome b involved in lipid metabolism
MIVTTWLTMRNLLIMLAVAAISFILLVGYFFSGTSQQQDDSPSSSSSSSTSPGSKRPLKPAPPLAQNNNDPVALFFSGSKDAVDDVCGSAAFTKQQLAQHASETDAWILVNGWVLNVTAFVRSHPGGVPMIMKGTGGETDAASLFMQFHQPSTVMLFKQFCIGKLASG